MNKTNEQPTIQIFKNGDYFAQWKGQKASRNRKPPMGTGETPDAAVFDLIRCTDGITLEYTYQELIGVNNV